MATVTGTIEAVSHKFDKFSILVDNTWYNTKKEWAPDPEPGKGDTVTFDDGGKNYLKKLKVVSGSGSSGKSAPQRAGVANLGVEVGHASNLAIQVVNQMGLTPGSEDYYKALSQETQNIYRLIKALKKSIETQAASAAGLEAEREAKEKAFKAQQEKYKDKGDETDLF